MYGQLTFEGVYFINKGMEQKNYIVAMRCHEKKVGYKTVKPPLLVACLTLVIRTRNAFRGKFTDVQLSPIMRLQ